jgi:hypothetical protein
MIEGSARPEASVETRAEAERSPADTVAFWRNCLQLAEAEEQEWTKAAQKVVDLYTNKAKEGGRHPYFNILFSNIETVVPALYNSTPVPDIRRRFGDADPVGRVASQIVERVLSYSADQYDFDASMAAAVRDMQIVGRGVIRVRYEPEIVQVPAGVDMFGQPTFQETIADQRVLCEHVAWRDFRRGPATSWRDVPWIAFRHAMTREELRRLNPEVADDVPLNYTVDNRSEKDRGKAEKTVYQRAEVWEIWDREASQVLFVCLDFPDGPLSVVADPLGLSGFFPIPRPLYDVCVPGSLVPVEPYTYYQQQAEELDDITARIRSIIRICKVRGIYSADLRALEKLSALADGELAPADDSVTMAAMQGGALDRGIWLWPVDTIAAVLRQLYEQREQIKATIYEITGVSDILRGSTSPSETATAQQIKAQWGSLRIQRRQAEVQRFARDLFRLKAEIVAEKFEPSVLMKVANISLPSEADKRLAQLQLGSGAPPDPALAEMLDSPTIEEVVALLRDDRLRGYRVDIETDSTIQADIATAQQNIGQFLQGFGAFIQAIGPAIQAGAISMEAAATLLQAFARPFKLGRQAEEALEKIGKEPPPMPAGMPPGAPPQQVPPEMAMQAGAPQMPPGAPPMPPQASTPQAVGMPLPQMPVMS